MSVLLAIHDQPGSFSDRWIEYCSKEGVSFKRVSCRDSAIVGQLAGVDGLLWNWSHVRPEDSLIARQVVTAAERMGIKVFPNALTSLHYDDKIAQKYLLEAIAAPLIPSYVFVDEESALQWIHETTFPKVFKLRCGAGSSNVVLVKTRQEGIRLCRRMFGKGRKAIAGGYFSDFRRKVTHTRDLGHFLQKLRRLPVSIASGLRWRHAAAVQQGYMYFQDFLAGNTGDTRMTVIGNRAFAFFRRNRPGDFRASGSGEIVYDPEHIDRRCLRTAFDVAQKLDSQSLAFDFVFDDQGAQRIVEISYTYVASAVQGCAGYWDENLNWQEGRYWPQDLILQDLLAAIGR